MTVKSPRRIRKDLEEAQNRTRLLVEVLRNNESEQRWGLGEECAKAAHLLEKILRENEIPQDYKVAVIGRFKAGKSSFVNELLGRRLAGEDTNPETAAITTFRAGPRVVATVNIVDLNTWEELKARHKQDAADPEAQRVANWFKFATKDQRTSVSAQGEQFDLDSIERAHLKKDNQPLIITMSTSSDAESERKAAAEFRRKIKEYTSGSKPHHCLVESIDIETPSPILGEGVVLVDTPGLDDTERLRVQLTKQAVQDVDAVLFLTKSGGAYGQAEKDFLLSLLRTGTVKQLVFVVTQVDQTYEQHVRDAREQDEDPEPISTRIASERMRIRAAIEATFDELASDSGSASAAKYREQLDSIEIAFTSAANHRDHVRREHVKYPLKPNDPGGMREVQETLFRTLSTESRLAATKRAIHQGTGAVLQHMLSIIDRRRLVVSGLKDREVAEQKLTTFREQFEATGRHFASVTRSDFLVLKTTLANRREIERAVSELIGHQADEVLGSYELEDAGRHWRTRRGGNWGFMLDLQTRVANRIFPKVAEQLDKQTEEFANFIVKFRQHVALLSSDAESAIARLEIGEELQLRISDSLENFLENALGSLQDLVQAEEIKIVTLLEDFVDEHVEAKITLARERVTGVWGRGTTAGQSAEVRSFYREVRSILRSAVQDHVRQRFMSFASHLMAEGDSLAEKSLSEVRAQIDRASADIRAAAEAAIVGQKDAFERTASALANAISSGQGEIGALLSDTGLAIGANDQSPPLTQETLSQAPVVNEEGGTVGNIHGLEATSPEDQDLDRIASIRGSATELLHRYDLKSGQKGWPYTRIFASKYFARAAEAWLVDPFLALRHQRRNLTELVGALIKCAKLKTLNIVTREPDSEGLTKEAEFYSRLDKEAFELGGIRIKFSRDEETHDRFLILDNGVVFKLGRGIDLYKPVAGLGAKESGLREVRSSEIDVFGPPGMAASD
jgi:predicted GTPase